MSHGTDLLITETDSIGIHSTTFSLSPESFESYLDTIRVFARDIIDESYGNYRYISWMDAGPNENINRGFVSLYVRPS